MIEGDSWSKHLQISRGSKGNHKTLPAQDKLIKHDPSVKKCQFSVQSAMVGDNACRPTLKIKFWSNTPSLNPGEAFIFIIAKNDDVFDKRIS